MKTAVVPAIRIQCHQLVVSVGYQKSIIEKIWTALGNNFNMTVTNGVRCFPLESVVDVISNKRPTEVLLSLNAVCLEHWLNSSLTRTEFHFR